MPDGRSNVMSFNLLIYKEILAERVETDLAYLTI